MWLDIVRPSEFLNKDINEKYELIGSRILFNSMSEDNLAKVMKTERMRNIVFKLAEVLKQEETIQKKFDFSPFIDSLLERDLPRIRKYLIIDILIGTFYRRDDDEKNSKDLLHLISILKELEDPLLIAYSVRTDTQHKVFSQDQIMDLFQQSSEMELIHFSATCTQDLIDNTVSILNTVPTADYKNMWIEGGFNPGYEVLLASSLESTFKFGGYLNSKKIGSLLQTILESNRFPSANPSIDTKIDTLYSGFIEVENLLFTADPKHRDHVFHSFHVFLLGISILALYHEVLRTHNQYRGEDFLCWVMTAFFHGIGYGIQKISRTTDKIEKHYKGIGSVKGPEFSFSESFRLYGEDLIKIMNALLLENRDAHVQYETIDTSLLESWEKREHGLISALIMLKTIDEYKSKDYMFSDYYFPERWRNIFVRAGLAMAIHTLPKERNWKIDVDYVPNRYAILNFKSHYLSYLLMIVDSIEYLNRPRFLPASEGFSVEQVQDVELKLTMKCTITDSHYLHLKFIADYTDLPFEKMIETATGIYKRLQHFISNDWGLTIVLQTTNEWEGDIFIQMKEAGLLPKKPLLKLIFQKKEVEEFLSVFGPKLKEYMNKEDELYYAFLKTTVLHLNIDPHNILKPANADYDTLMKKHYISPEVDPKKVKLLNEFFNNPIIDDFIPKTSIGFQNFIRWIRSRRSRK